MTSDFFDFSINDPLSDLEASAVRLNDLSSKANAHLSDLENKLVALNLGIEYWSDQSLLLTQLQGSLYVKQVLGFARVEGAWCLAVRDVRFEKQTSYKYRVKEKVVSLSAPIPIRKAPRELRIEAAQKVNRDIFLRGFQLFVSSKLDAYDSSMT